MAKPAPYPLEQLVLATNNKNKVREIADLLARHGWGDVKISTIGDYTDIEPEENGGSYRANAMIKARAAAAVTGLPCLAEDSGVEFAAMAGAPGVDTAPWIAAQGGWETAMAQVAERVGETGLDQAQFYSTFVLAWPDGATEEAAAICPGRFVHPARGTDGFGHDPYFVPGKVEGFNYFIPYTQDYTQGRTYAEMGLAEKQKISPRAIALTQLLTNLTVKLSDHDRYKQSDRRA